jgi:hypothetical protein
MIILHRNLHPSRRVAPSFSMFLGLLLLTFSLSPSAGSTSHSRLSPAAPIDNLKRVGIETHENDPAVYQGIAATGAGYVRMSVLWSQIEPANTTPDNFDWSSYDLTFSRIISSGIVPLATIIDCPTWACPRDIGPLYTNMYTETAQFMGALAARYSGSPYNIHNWEMWNEPDGSAGPTPGDHSWGWGAFPDRYALMLQNVYPAIKAADRQALVMTGGVAYGNFWSEGGPFNPDFLPGVFANGARPYVDAIAYHYYSNDQRYAHIGGKADDIRSAIGSEAQNVPFVCTEAGLTSDPAFGSSEAIQARYVVKLFAWAASSGVRSVSWYLYKDYNSPDPAQQIFTKSGLVRINGYHKPSYDSLHVYTHEIGSAPFVRALGPGDGLPADLEGYQFMSPPGNDSSLLTSVLWSRTGVSSTITIPADQAPSVVRAVGLHGEPLAMATGSGDTLLVSVGADPVYIEMNFHPLRFADVPYRFWAYDYVEYLAANHIVGGYPDGTFRPSNTATRGQFAKMDTLGMVWPLQNPPDPTFADVAPGSTFYLYVETAYSRTVISGYPCGSPGEPCDPQSRPYFRPGNNVTRAQIAKIIVKSKGWTLLNPTEPTFTDIPYGSSFYEYIETAVSKGILAGYPCGGTSEPCDPQSRPYFRPGNNATRAQLSKMLALALQQP